MPRYRKKPVEIEAFQYHYGADSHTASYPKWLMDAVLLGAITDNLNGKIMIQTLEGKMTVDDGDFIIQGIKGELYPCKPDIFAATYEPV